MILETCFRAKRYPVVDGVLFQILSGGRLSVAVPRCMYVDALEQAC